MIYQLEKNDGSVVLWLTGEMTSNDQPNFDSIYKEISQLQPSSIVIDLKNLTYLDSIGLGFLISLREEYFGGEASAATLRGAQGDVEKILTAACFEKLFTIS